MSIRRVSYRLRSSFVPITTHRRRGRRGLVPVALLSAAVLIAGCSRGDVTGQTPATAMRDGVVHLSMGLVRGEVAVDYRLFQGIPYAAAPVGPLRWQPPQPPAPWPGMRDASKPGPQCMQESRGRKSTSEDCLSLNVWTPPVTAGAGKHPVMVWIHGGGFVNGSGDIYNARAMAAQGHIVVVTLNYRLGALGFLAHPALGGDAGNYGLADQQAALRWVQHNIADFGGDPGKVTIAGESAGAMSVCDHLVAPGSAGLFRAAIIQSGPCQAQVNLATAQHASSDYAASVGCGNPDTAAGCLRALQATALARPPWYARIGDSDSLSGPVTGTATLPVDPVAASAAGHAARVPVLIGTTHDEFTMFAALRYLRLGRGVTAAEYPDVLSDIFGADGKAVAAHYPPERYGGDVSLAYSAAVTDGEFTCVADRLARRVAPRRKRVRLRVRRPSCARTGSVAACAVSGRRQSLTGVALSLRHRGRPAARSRAAHALRANDPVLEPIRDHRRAERGRPTRLAPAQRRSRTQFMDDVAARRPHGDDRLRRLAPMSVLGRFERKLKGKR